MKNRLPYSRNLRPYLFVRLALIIMIAFAGTFTARAQAAPADEYQLKAVFIFNFTRFVEWPPVAFDSYNDDFIIAILGSDPFGEYLQETITGEVIGRHPIVIKRVTDVKQVSRCHILFINEKDPLKVKNALNECEHLKALTVGDVSNFASLGGMIGFYTDNNKIRMQINSTAARNAQLNISSKLLRLAKVL